MSFCAHIVDPAARADSVTGEADEEFSAFLGMEEHSVLFGLPEVTPEKFPLLWRFHGHHADACYLAAELEALILEIEGAASLVGPESPILLFTGRFHSLCCVAWTQGKSVAVSHPGATTSDRTIRFPLVEGARPISDEDVARLQDEP